MIAVLICLFLLTFCVSAFAGLADDDRLVKITLILEGIEVTILLSILLYNGSIHR